MRKSILSVVMFCAFSTLASADEVMTKQQDGTYVVNTTTLCDVKGYKSPTPVEVYIKGGKVLKVEALPNKETKSYFAKIVNGLLPKYVSLKVSKAKRQAKVQTVDVCTGATFSCKAVQQNIMAALDYYEKNK